MSDTLSLGVIQLTSGIDPAANARALSAALDTAAAQGARIAFTPEMTGLLDGRKERLLASLAPEEADASLAVARAQAARHRIWVHLGSCPIRLDSGKVANRAFLIDDAGAIRARYDKLHLFDVDLPSGERYRESSTYEPGTQAVLAQTPWGGLGLSICYDLRFAYLYRELAQQGARMIAVPAAFTHTTGKAHWHVLLRARAIETGCFVIAAAQTGTHEDGRTTFGHSLVVAPWGEVLLDAGEAPGVHAVTLDLGQVDEARGRVPALRHDRCYDLVRA